MCLPCMQTFSEEDATIMKQSFADSTIYLGGFYAPNRIARQPLVMLHGHGHLEGCREISPGVYTGGETFPIVFSASSKPFVMAT